MREAHPHLTHDEAVAHFTAAVREVFGPSDRATASVPQYTLAEREAFYLRTAETIVSLICREPRACRTQSCRRASVCRHHRDLHAALQRAHQQPSRRSPGALAVRYAMWLFVTYAGQDENG